MLNPDYIPWEYAIPLALIMWGILFVMILRDRRRIHKLENPKLNHLKILNKETGEWEVIGDRKVQELFDQEAYNDPNVDPNVNIQIDTTKKDRTDDSA